MRLAIVGAMALMRVGAIGLTRVGAMRLALVGAIVLTHAGAAAAQTKTDAYKKEAAAGVEGMAKMAQEMVDMVFSFGELGHQEVETSRYLTGILEKNGFTIQRGVSGMPTAWVARWGSG